MIRAPDESQRHAYIRNLVAEHNAESPAARRPLQHLGKPLEEEEDKKDGDEQTESIMQLTVDYTGVVKRSKKETPKKQQTLEDRLRAEALALRFNQARVVPEDWMERSAENQFGSSSYFIDSDDEGADDDKDVAAEIHTMDYCGSKHMYNTGTCDTFFERETIFNNLDMENIQDRVSFPENSDTVTTEQQSEWHADKLDPTQKLLHDYICKTWFHGIIADYVSARPLRKLQIKEFGTAGSGKTRLNRTMVVSMRFILQSLRLAFVKRKEEKGDESHLMAKDLCLFLQNIDLADVITDLGLESTQLSEEQLIKLWLRLKHFSEGAKIRWTAYIGVASTLLGFGAKTVCSLFKTGTTNFKETLDGPLAVELQSDTGLGFAVLTIADEVSFIGGSLLGKMELRSRQARTRWLDEAKINSDDKDRNLIFHCFIDFLVCVE